MKCEIGIGIIARSVGHATVRSNAPAATASSWQDFYAQAIACFGDPATFSPPNNSASCTGEGYVGIQESFAGNGSWMNLHWETPIHYASQGFSFTKTWIGVGGNNTTHMSVGDNWDYTSPIVGQASMQLRIWNNYCNGGASMCFKTSAYWQTV
jgi:hypothetical protein